MKRNMHVLCISVMLALSPVALAQKATGQALVAGKIAANFTNLAGSDANALALVNALRTGTNATLTYPAPPTTGTTPPPTTTGTGTTPPPTTTGTGTTPPPTTTTVTYDPPTGKMGWGNVKIALALAQASLASAGITNPTSDQLQAALNGGSVTVTNADGTTTTTALKGVLQMRASGMGWGQIAHANGTNVGPVVSGLKMANAPVTAAGTSAPPSGAAPKSMSASAGITTAAGGSAGVVSAGGSTTGNSHGNAFGRGIVTAAGGGASLGASTAASHGHGAGVVTASGGAATSVTTAQGNSGNHGKPEGKGKGGG